LAHETGHLIDLPSGIKALFVAKKVKRRCRLALPKIFTSARLLKNLPFGGSSALKVNSIALQFLLVENVVNGQGNQWLIKAKSGSFSVTFHVLRGCSFIFKALWPPQTLVLITMKPIGPETTLEAF